MRNSFYSLFSIVFLLGISILASSDSQDHKVFPFAYEVKDFDNGLRVIVIPTDYPNIVSLQIPVSVGSRNEIEPGKSGFAHFFEHMMFRGTENYSSDAYNEILKNAGADQNAYTTDDYTNYHITFSKEDLETILMLEADRFQNLKYSLNDFKTEAKAVLGEYNKNSANPINKLLEVQSNVAFQEHTYKHTTMGFIEDIENMPNQFEYSRLFFDRYYRPENTTIILSGDVDAISAFKLIETYWGKWKRGSYKIDIPQETAFEGPIYKHVAWEQPTTAWVLIGFHGPAFSDTNKEMATLDVISKVAFSHSSTIYQKLVVQEQVALDLFPHFPDHTDPNLVMIGALLKDQNDVWKVRDEILKTLALLRARKVASGDILTIQSNLRNQVALGLDNSVSIAEAIVSYVARTRDPESINKVYQLYDQVTPEDIQAAANKYFTDERMVTMTLAIGDLPETKNPSGSVDHLSIKKPVPELKLVVQKMDSPLVNFRLLFNVGAADDLPGKYGLAELTARMIAQGSSLAMSYKEIQKALHPMAAGFRVQVDKEITVFQGAIHKTNLDSYFEIISDMLVNPAWKQEDFERIKTGLLQDIEVNLRSNNDEELGKEVLYEFIYQDHPYGSLTLGHIDTVKKLTLGDVKAFYLRYYTQASLVVGLAGGVTEVFIDEVKQTLGNLEKSSDYKVESIVPTSEPINGYEAQIIQKDTRGVAVSFGFPIEVTRSHPDFIALWLARSYLGEHRSSNSHLFQRIREIRGMNYGDYAYIEYFPRGMNLTMPEPNLARQSQIFQIWIRPVVNNEHAHFATRVALHELNKLITDGLSPDAFEATRNFLLKYSNLLTASQDRILGYALDSAYYRNSNFNLFISEGLKELTLEKVNKAIRAHLQIKNIKFVFISPDAEDLQNRLVKNTPSVMTYDSEKPAELLAEDKILSASKLPFEIEKVSITPVEAVFSE
jgi:zinc protease